MHISRRHLNYANVTATLALVFAMSGGAMAAKHYLIESTKQINPKVLKKLKGNAGKAGAPGANGATGAAGATGSVGAIGPQGPTGKEGTAGKEGSPGKNGEPGKEGKQGEPGPLLATLPSGKTETGSFGAAQYTASSATGISFVIPQISYPFPLASEPTPEVIQEGGSSTTHCPGSATAPSAAPGFLCIYVSSAFEIEGGVSVESFVKYKLGAEPFASAKKSNVTAQLFGTWAVTAP